VLFLAEKTRTMATILLLGTTKNEPIDRLLRTMLEVNTAVVTEVAWNDPPPNRMKLWKAFE
jgi:hypothetical protein